MVARPSVVVRPVIPSGEPFGFCGYCSATLPYHPSSAPSPARPAIPPLCLPYHQILLALSRASRQSARPNLPCRQRTVTVRAGSLAGNNAPRIARTGCAQSAALIQRFGSALNFNIHLMCIHARHLRACGFYCQAGCPGAQARSQSDTFSRCICPEQQTPGTGDPGEAGQGQQIQIGGRAGSLYLLSWRIAPCEVLAGFDTRQDTSTFKSNHHPISRIAPGLFTVVSSLHLQEMR